MKLAFGSLLVGFCFALCTGCEGDAELNQNSDYLKVFPVGVSHHEMTVENGEPRLYTMWVPKSYSPDSPVPLVLALHFGGRVSPYYGRGVVDALVKPGLEDLGGIIVAPDSIAGGWNNDENEKMVLELVNDIQSRFNIDRTRILLTGFSMGGHGVWYIGGRNQDVFSAALPIAGAPNGDAEWDIPLFIIHSSADTVVPIGPTEEKVEQLKAAGKDVTFLKLSEIPHFKTRQFAKPMSKAVPWLKEKWGMSD